MKITKEEVKHVAHLARLEFDQNETEMFTAQLSDILDYIDQLNQVDTEGVPPMTHAMALRNAFREDVIIPSLTDEIVLGNASETRGSSFRVPKVIE
ncbi:MAG: Asp-tRNA(Asn)/Glu-tRNA(Gln) amidotransferase subunit GatC [Syntrophobacterales bacterium]|nr:Asp-tRNA(Asn)/Glu-tRNA(Gln) amidotransferase subunit GatC [Syntrophobacterales bacterium]